MNPKQRRRVIAGTASLAFVMSMVEASHPRAIFARAASARTTSITPSTDVENFSSFFPGVTSDNATQQLLNLRQGEFPAEPLHLAQQPQARVALVIGNAAYEDDPLANPVNDAIAIHRTLSDLGFDTLPLVLDANKQEMIDALREFEDQLEAGAIGVFYYAGHGVQVNGTNYLVPLEADLEREVEVEFEAVDLKRVIRAMDSVGTAFNMLIVDACRDNPFYRRWSRTRGSSIRGLSAIRPPRGTLIAYATEPNDVAEDGGNGDRHSPFTQSLLTHLQIPGISILDLLTRVTEDVLEATDERQSPYFEGNPTGFFSFNPDIEFGREPTNSDTFDSEPTFEPIPAPQPNPNPITPTLSAPVLSTPGSQSQSQIQESTSGSQSQSQTQESTSGSQSQSQSQNQ